MKRKRFTEEQIIKVSQAEGGATTARSLLTDLISEEARAPGHLAV